MGAFVCFANYCFVLRCLSSLAGSALCPLCASNSFASEGHWGYEGATGPEKWGGLDAADARARQAASSLPSTSPPRSAPGSRRSGSAGASDPTRSSTTATPFSLTSGKATRSAAVSKARRRARPGSRLRCAGLRRPGFCGGCRPSWAGTLRRVIAARPPLGDRTGNNVLDNSIHTRIRGSCVRPHPEPTERRQRRLAHGLVGC